MDALQAHGVSQEQTDTLLAWADDFNARVTTPTLTEGFTAMEGDFVDYSSLLFDIKELPDGTFFMEANCRLTAFLLMRDQLQTCGTADESDTYLMFDIEAIDTQKEYQLSSEARADFITLFNAVPLEGAANQEEHLARIEEAWSERGIQVDSAKGMSLIEVYLHSPLDGVRFVGHTGVLMETEDGLLFVEKYGPAGPFQATKFESRNALEDYCAGKWEDDGDILTGVRVSAVDTAKNVRWETHRTFFIFVYFSRIFEYGAFLYLTLASTLSAVRRCSQVRALIFAKICRYDT